MKKLITLVLVLICMLSLLGCNQLNKEQPLSYLVGVQEMISNIAKGDMEKAWYPVYADKANAELSENMKLYAEMFDGRDVKRCDCYDFERTGDRTVEGELYKETTYYKIYLTEDYTGEPDFYAKAVGISDGNGDGIISLEIYEESPK